MKKLKRFILLTQMVLNEKVLQSLRPIPNCHECSWRFEDCPIQDKSKCPMKDLVGISTRVLGVIDADDYKMIRIIINSLHLMPKITFIFLIDSEKDIGYIYKAEGTFYAVKKGIMADSIRQFESRHKTSIVIEAKDARNTVRPTFSSN